MNRQPTNDAARAGIVECVTIAVEVKCWVLGFGANVMVVDPESLRVDLAGRAWRMLAFYAHYQVCHTRNSVSQNRDTGVALFP